MIAETRNKQSPLVPILSVIALIILLFIVKNPFSSELPHSTPAWWVSLTAPQYPESAFPDGIRIHFHVDGVFNGCEMIDNVELSEDEALNCKHEMDAINHYVGMYPIAAGAPVERLFSPFVFSLLGLMILAFAIPDRKARVGVLAAGSLVITVWMSMAMFSQGGANMLTDSYLHDVTTTMDLDPEDIEDWTGFEIMQESYQEALGRYFRDIPMIERNSAIVGTAAYVVYGGVIAAMIILVVGNWFSRRVYWLLPLVPVLLPVFFLIDYAGWLWWFGHNLNEMGAFTVKPFMPTVFGQGKVAQFATHSYPHTGFFMMLGLSVVLGLAALLRRKQLKGADEV